MLTSRLRLIGWTYLGWLLVWNAPPSHGQSALPEFTSGQQLRPLLVSMDILTTRGVASDSTRVDCVYRIANDLFIFTRQDDQYRARYEVTLTVNDSDDFQLLAHTVEDSVVVTNEQDTHLIDGSKPKIFSTVLPPGEYEMVMLILDFESMEQYRLKRKFKVSDYFKHDLSVSDVQFASLINVDPALSPDAGGLNVVTNLDRMYGEDQPEMYIYYEIYTSAEPDARKPIKVDYRIRTMQGKTVYKESGELDRQGKVGVYSHAIYTGELPQDSYRLELEVHDEAIKKTAQVKGDFNIRWRYLVPLTGEKNYKQILEQLQYIAKKDEIKEMKKAKTTEARRAALEAFWKSRDASPETEINENMLTYYSRIDYADKQFTRGIGKGWKSDMGRIYIIYGPPDEVDRRPFERNSNPYQLWHYNSIARTFMFVDFDGFGNYQLYQIY